MLISIIATLVVVGLVVWLLSFLPIPDPYMTIIRVIILIVVILWILSLFVGPLGVGGNGRLL
jgi:hypothetical protein